MLGTFYGCWINDITLEVWCHTRMHAHALTHTHALPHAHTHTLFGFHWFGHWLLTYSAPWQSPNQWWLIIPPAQQNCWGVYWFHSVRPSVRLSVSPSVRPHPSHVPPAFCVHSVAPTVLVGSISYLYILSNNFRRCVACKVSCKISKFEFLAFFKNL